MRKERFKVWIRDLKEFADQDMVKAHVFVDCDGIPIWRDNKDNLHNVSKMVDIVYVDDACDVNVATDEMPSYTIRLMADDTEKIEIKEGDYYELK